MNNITLEGVVTSVVFSNPENGYAVLRLDTDGGIATAAGCIPGASQYERLKLFGSWTTHPQYGEQFKAESYEVIPPSGAEEIYRYLASGAIKNIGPSKARDIVEKFGENALGVIENEPEKLTSIKGISLKSAHKITEVYRRQAGLRRLMDLFSQYGITPVVAMRVYRDYGDESTGIVKENPYIITADSYGAEFSGVDAMALDLGFESDSPERVSAAIVFELVHNLNNGHTFIPEEKLIRATGQLIGAENESVKDALDALCECGDIVIDAIAGEKGCYLRHMHDAEQYVASRIKDMARLSDAPEDLQIIIRNIEQGHGIKYADMQRAALELAAKSCVVALTGGPGTGKTTTVRGILTLFNEMGLKTLLCAPTGRAAKRLSETCGSEAATIHRMLGASLGEYGAPVFDCNEDNLLEADAVIVDESSMIDILLMRSLLAAMRRGSRLIMVGDADQLPPVGPGSVFSDTIKSGIVPTVVLSEIFRQAEDSGIVLCSHNVNNGIMPNLERKFPDLFFMRRPAETQLAETVAELYGHRLPKNMGIDPVNIQVLSPTRKRLAGTAMLNERLREAVNPPHPQKKEKKWGEFLFRTGDKVMQIRNNYDIIWRSSDGSAGGAGIYNGDVGVITNIDHEKETVTVDYEDKLVTYLFEQLPELEPAFAMTVHKSQGSEYQAVILALTAAAPQLLTRSILYTAMTRAKKLLVMVGSSEIMMQMVNNDRRHKRYSGLNARLREF